MRLIFIGAFATLAAMMSGRAARATDHALDISPAFKGTIVSTFPDGRQTRLWLERNGSYRATSRSGDMTSGHWKIKDTRMCLRQEQPLAAPWDYCTGLPPRLDASWQGKSAFGLPITIKLVKGRG